MKSRSKSGFTLVEILIVVVILGILAAIVIPQFSEASTQARTSSVSSNLQMIRSQIELYKIQHGDKIPAMADLVTALTTETNFAGAAYDAVNDDTSYGPYMQKFPENAVNGGDVTLLVATTGRPAAAATDSGWAYDVSNGMIYASNDPEL